MNKYTVKLILWKHDANEHGNLPIYIQITINRKTSYISTGHFVTAKTWDPKDQQIKATFRDAQIINTDIANRKNAVIRKIVELQVAQKDYSAKSVKAHFTGRNLNNIFEFIDQFKEEVKNKRDPVTINIYTRDSKKLELFHGSRTLNFEDIDPAFLYRYENYLLTPGDDGKVLSNNYIHALFKSLKMFFNAAKLRGIIKHYPFDAYENPVYLNPVKDYLNLEELATWEDFADETTNQTYKQTAIYFLLGCYSGLRISDWYAFDLKKHIVNGRIKLRPKKTEKTGEWVTMPISTPLRRNLARIEQVPLRIEEPTLNEKLKVIAAKCGINKHVTSHTGRHTFAITLCADQGISSETCAELMGISVKTCVDSYYRVTNRKIDKETNEAWSKLL